MSKLSIGEAPTDIPENGPHDAAGLTAGAETNNNAAAATHKRRST